MPCVGNDQVCLDCGDPVASALGHTYNASHLCTRCNEQAPFTVAGTGAHLGTEWDTGNTANDMTYADGVYTKVYTKVAAGSYKFKVVRDHDWGTAYPDADKAYTVAESGSTVTITLKGTAVDVKVEVPVVECTHEWADATCDKPQTCKLCGKDQGEALGHSFDADGKCTVCEYAPSYIIAGDVMQVNEVYQQGTNFFGTSWNANDTNNKMGYSAELGLFAKTYTGVKAGEYHYQVTSSGSWFGVDNCYIKVDSDNSTVTITFNPNGNVMNATVEAHVHSWSDATCTEPQKCECGETQGEALGHSHNAVVTAPDCVNGGYTTYTCACGDTYTGAETAALGHSFAEGVCSVCGEVDPDYVAPVVNDKLINFSTWEEFAKETYADGDTVKHNDYFTFIYSKNSRVDSSSKTWDDFSGTLRFSLGGKTPAGVPTKNAIQITVDGAHTLKIWYVAGGDARYFELRDAEGNALATTTSETTKNSQYYAELSIPAAGVYYLTVPADNNYIFQLELVEAEAPAHVNALVVGDINKIVVNGETLNAYGFPIEWVTFYAEEKANYAFAGEGATIAIFDLEGNLLCNYTGAADLEAGYYLICVGAYATGEYNVAVTKSEIVVAPDLNNLELWVSDGSLYTVNGYNIKYNGAGNTYACVGTDVTAFAAGNNTFTITITNNGSATAKVRVDLQATVQVGNHKVVNVSAVGGDVWTDSEWGGSHVHVAPGESVTLVITYDETTERGAVKDLIIFADSGRGDAETYSADITISGLAFSKVTDEEPEDYTNTLVVGDTNKIVISESNSINNGYGYYVVWVPFVAEEKAHYTFAGENLAIYIYDAAYTFLSDNGTADLEAGNYLICIAYNALATFGEYNVAVTKTEIVETPVEPPHEHSFVEGKCECGESDPNYVPPVEENPEEDPEEDPIETPNETPADPQPEEPVVELNFFEQIMKAITDFLAQITAWFENLFAGFKK